MPLYGNEKQCQLPFGLFQCFQYCYLTYITKSKYAGLSEVQASYGKLKFI